MNTILKLCSASALFFSISQPLAHASLCGEGVPNGTLQMQLDFLIACEPHRDPNQLGCKHGKTGTVRHTRPAPRVGRTSPAALAAASPGMAAKTWAFTA
jgi:hypothetical protein